MEPQVTVAEWVCGYMYVQMSRLWQRAHLLEMLERLRILSV